MPIKKIVEEIAKEEEISLEEAKDLLERFLKVIFEELGVGEESKWRVRDQGGELFNLCFERNGEESFLICRKPCCETINDK